MKYIDLHIHTKYTTGNGITEIPALVKRAKEYHMEGLAIVDSASILGFKEFEDECLKNSIKPIFGCGFYFNYDSDNFAHLVLLAKNRIGLKVLTQLDRESKENLVQGKPVIDFDSLTNRSKDLIALTGGLGGVFDKLYNRGDKSGAYKNIEKLKGIFKDNLYLELQDNGLRENKVLQEVIIDLAKRESINIVISGGSFYLDSTDSIKCNQIRKKYGNRELKGGGFNFKSPKEIEKLYPGHILKMDSSYNIGKLCNY